MILVMTSESVECLKIVVHAPVTKRTEVHVHAYQWHMVFMNLVLFNFILKAICGLIVFCFDGEAPLKG